MTLRELAIKSLAPILVGVGLLSFVATPAHAQSRGQFALPDLGSGVRKTNPDFAVVVDPFWHGLNDIETNPPAGFTFVTGVAITSIDLCDYTSPPEGYTGAGVCVVTVQSGTLPTGITLVASVLAGTPTADNGDVTFLSTLDGAGTDPNTFTFTLEGTDTTPPTVPTNLSCGPTGGTSQTELTCTMTAATDASGILNYRFRQADTESECNSGTSTQFELSADTIGVLGGLTAGQTKWIKANARDNSPAQNLGAFTACVPGTTATAGGGGDLIVDDDFETGSVPNTTLWGDSDGCNSGDCAQFALVSTGGAYSGSKYLRTTLTANAPNGGNYRAEQNSKVMPADPDDGEIAVGDTIYYGISYRMPAATPYDPEKNDTLTQWMQQPTIQPHCHHTIQVENNTLKWHSHDCSGAGGNDATLLSAFAKDQWVRVCAKYKWTTASNGEIKIWVNPASENSTPVKNYSGQTLITGWQNFKFKIGDYKTGWRTNNPASNMAAMSPREFHHDDIRIGRSFADACAPR